MATQRGGKRAGAGRPRKADTHERPIKAAEKKFADKLPQLADNVLALAAGGQLSETLVYEPAGMVTVDDTEVVETEKGAISVKIKRLVFPDMDADELVLVRKTVSVAAPNLQASVYAMNRIMGTPTERQELSGPDGAAIPVTIESAIDRIYSEPPPEDETNGDGEE